MTIENFLVSAGGIYVEGMLDVRKKDKEIGNHLKNLVLKDNGMKIIESKITELLNSDTLPDSKQFLKMTLQMKSHEKKRMSLTLLSPFSSTIIL